MAAEKKPQKHFKSPSIVSKQDKGIRDMAPLAPFIISGGKNTERYYFQHISSLYAQYPFEVRPRFFGKESKYTEEFPLRIKEILREDIDAKIFCVFDWDTIRGNKENLKKHKDFIKRIKAYIDNGQIILCPSMPSFEYWFLLHFKNTTQLIVRCNEVANRLKPYMKSYFSQKDISLFDVLKSEKYLEKSDWVKNLCSSGKLDAAIKRAEDNIKAAEEAGDLANQSYSYVYKAFKER